MLRPLIKCDERLAFLKSLRHWSTFGRGWQTRVTSVRSYGLKLAGEEEPITPSVEYKSVKLGSTGKWVKKLQEALKIEVSGDFDASTDEALKAFQQEAGLEVDGIAGRKTYQALGLISS